MASLREKDVKSQTKIKKERRRITKSKSKRPNKPIKNSYINSFTFKQSKFCEYRYFINTLVSNYFLYFIQ